MASALGQRVGVGRTAEVFEHGDLEVVKILRPGIPDAVGEHEASIGALVDAAGVAAPRFRGTVRIDGRFAIRYERLHGPSMLERITKRPLEIDLLAGQFAELHARMHDADGSEAVNEPRQGRPLATARRLDGCFPR